MPTAALLPGNTEADKQCPGLKAHEILHRFSLLRHNRTLVFHIEKSKQLFPGISSQASPSSLAIRHQDLKILFRPVLPCVKVGVTTVSSCGVETIILV